MITTVFIVNYYEYTISNTQAITKSYYYAGSTRVAMRDGGTLYFLLSDHLGSTSLTVEEDESTVYAEQRYSPWGSVRYTAGTMPTDFTYTGQRSETASFGLMYYGARWYDPLGRFTQADTDVPESQGIQAWDRFAYVNNNPIRYNDPTGHVLDAGCETVGCGSTKEDLKELYDYEPDPDPDEDQTDDNDDEDIEIT
jgi:RHS repeat-associated protein